MTPLERALVVGTPFVAVAVVAVGLRIGAADSVRAAEVFGAAEASAGTGLAWQVVAFEESHGIRTPISGADLVVEAGAGSEGVRVERRTNADGVAEVLLPLHPRGPIAMTVWGSAEGARDVWASGTAAQPPAGGLERGATAGAWMPFSRRTGSLRIDVAVVGQRVAPGFAASVCARVSQSSTRGPAANVDVSVVDDPSLRATRGGRTNSAGWATIELTPVGLALSLELEARSAEGDVGSWSGGLVAAPGGADIRTRPRWSSDEPLELDVVLPSARATEYVEIDDVHGRAWAAAIEGGTGTGDGQPIALRAPALSPGLYWAFASGTADGAVVWTAGTTMRPFFVAASDEAALALAGGRAAGCTTPVDPRETPGMLAPCMATVAPRPVPRWKALDGAPAKREAAATARARGLAMALGALLVASLLEATLLARLGRAARIAIADADETGPAPRPGRRASRASTLLVAICVALLGFALLAAFLTRAG